MLPHPPTKPPLILNNAIFVLIHLQDYNVQSPCNTETQNRTPRVFPSIGPFPGTVMQAQ